MDGDWRKHSGGRHCGRVRFEVLAPAEIEASECKRGSSLLLTFSDE